MVLNLLYKMNSSYPNDWIVLFEGAYVDDHGLNVYGIYVDSVTEEPHCGLLFFDVTPLSERQWNTI